MKYGLKILLLLILPACLVASGREPVRPARYTARYHAGSSSRRNLLKSARFRWDNGRIELLKEARGQAVFQAEPAFTRSGAQADHIPGARVQHMEYRSGKNTEPQTLRILALRVEFQEDEDEKTTGNGRFDLSRLAAPAIDAPPHDRGYFENQLFALSSYYRNVSRGKLILTGDVSEDIFTLPHAMGFYNPATDGETLDRGLGELFRDAVLLADARGILFSSCDALIIFHAGVGRDIDLGLDPTPGDIPSVFLNLEDLRQALAPLDPGYRGIPVENGTFFVEEGILLPETQSQEGYEIGLLGTTALMFGFQLGLPALWDTETGRSGIGKWGLMDQGSGNFNGLIPAEPCAWSKVFLGWETPVDIQYGEFHVACSAIQDPGKIYRIMISDDEYYLLENRNYDPDRDSVAAGVDENGISVTFTPEGLIEAQDTVGVIMSVDHYDYGLPGSGILIWHIDESVIAAKLPENRVNADKNRRGVDLEEADGAQDIGETYDFLDAGYGAEGGVLHDAWFSGNEVHLLANRSESVAFTPDSYPATRSNSGSNTHLMFRDFSGIDTLMTFSLSNTLLQAGFPADFGMGENPFPPQQGDLDGDGARDIVVGSRTGRIFVWKDSGTGLTEGAAGYRVTLSGDTSWFKVPVYADAGRALAGAPVIADFGQETGEGSSGGDEVFAPVAGGSIAGWRFVNGQAQSFFLWAGEGIEVTDLIFLVGRLVAGSVKGDVWAIGPDGNTLWKYEGKGYPVAGLSGTGDGNILVTAGEAVFLLDQSGGLVRETKNNMGPFTSPAAFYNPVSGYRAHAFTGSGAGIILEGNDQSTLFGEGLLDRNFSHPVLTDLDRDGFLEAVLTGNGRIWAFNHNGTLADRFPVPLYERETGLSSPVLGDVDGDGSADIVVQNSDGNVEAFHADGRPVDGFPLATGGDTLSPLILDLDGDGDVELVSVSGKGYLLIWDLPGRYNEKAMPWPSSFHDAAHTRLNTEELKSLMPVKDVLPERLVYNYPNPTEGNFTTIRYRLEASAEVMIDIYDLGGEKVAEFEGPGAEQTENEVIWSLNDVGSGVYLCRVRAKSTEQEKAVIFKIAVVK